ncbi:tyrosyl-tRNA synthetase [Anseongella ginsenosidimutans]|uniref:Tyrosine--tRNA ligase n=1 Tax=Anseongella ginsenosidimutans TaxID=496056 RepID=A0A4R3L1T7_9SPHI|nr:tyrosine--tRNA ligase [Anseongella ginsenosidimutans]QEC50964.1 tyrosine--tRNA ligase [Anseongella ginsenosidimutans]TCS90392.1 tyrosyl-tRNA synthetase [Anseongella ginsenosidimutans]
MARNKNFVEELRWRGMLHDIMPGTEDKLQQGVVSGYIGFDPTADSLHVGHLTQVMTLIHFQRAGHKPIALVGGATGMVGDPSFKAAERKLLTEEALRHNIEGIRRQLEKFLEFGKGANAAEMVNNYDWLKNYSFLEFIRDIGKHITVNYMMAKDSVKKRLEGDSGLSFTEFSYQLLQGYDFFHLWKHRNCLVQMGGSDQWGNIVTGTELIRRMEGGEAFAITTRLITKADGTKFGKTEGGNVWLDPSLTSPYKFYQFWLNASDEDVKKYVRIFTLAGQDEIVSLEAEHDKAPHLRLLQKFLAKDITSRVHSPEDYETSVKASEILFGNATSQALNELPESLLLSVLEGVPRFEVSRTELDPGIGIVELLTEKAAVFPSKSEARKMIQGGGVSINKNKITSADQQISPGSLINGRYFLAQRGKKNYYLIVVK